jgi:hypothetical protein
VRAVDPTSDPLGWLRDVRATFGTMLRHCGPAEAERYFRACEPEAARAMSALPPRSVGLVADLQAECLAALDEHDGRRARDVPQGPGRGRDGRATGARQVQARTPRVAGGGPDGGRDHVPQGQGSHAGDAGGGPAGEPSLAPGPGLLDVRLPALDGADGVEVPYREDGTIAVDPFAPAPAPADENRPTYPLEGKRLALEDWLARWEDLAHTHPAHLLPVLYHAAETTQARREIREDVRFDQAVLTRLVEAADVMAARTEGKAGKRRPTPRKRT